MKQLEFISLIVTLSFLIALSSCQVITHLNSSQTKTVFIDQSEVKHQKKVGFCWAYATCAMVESLALPKGINIDISEEYVGYYSLYYELLDMLNTEKPYIYVKEGNSLSSTLKLLKTVGLVPEEVYKKKFTELSDKNLAERLNLHFNKLIESPEILQQLKTDTEFLHTQLSLVFGSRPPLPDRTFTYKDQTYTPMSFMEEYLSFKPDNYVSLLLDSSSINTPFDISKMWEKNAEILKRSLLNNIPVPIVLMMSAHQPTNGVYQECSELECPYTMPHALLAVDFVTKGGKTGKMSNEEIKNYYYEPLESLIVKNSWGYSSQGTVYSLTQLGEPVSGNEDVNYKKSGYQKVEIDYIKKSIKKTYFQMIVDRSIFKAEFFPYIRFKSLLNVKSPVLKPSDKPIEFEIFTIDLPRKKTSEVINYELIVTNEDDKTSKLHVFNERKLLSNIPPLKPGKYTFTLNSKFAEISDTDSQTVIVLDLQHKNMLNENYSAISTNQAHIIENDGNRSILLDTTTSQPIQDLNLSTVTVPNVKVQKGGTLQIQYIAMYTHFNNKDAIRGKLNYRLANGDAYQQAFCKTQYLNKSDINVTHAHFNFLYLCQIDLPDEVFKDVSEMTISLQFMFNQEPTPDKKILCRTEITYLQYFTYKAKAELTDQFVHLHE